MKKIFKKTLRNIIYFIELALIVVMLGIFRVVGIACASYMAGALTRVVGKKHKSHKTAYKNIREAMPEIKEQEVCRLLDRLWMNLGRVIGEYIFICRMGKKQLEKRMEIDKKSMDNIKKMVDSKKGGIIFSGHIGNWEVGLRYLMLCGVKLNVLYRPLNNRYADWVMCVIREFDPIPKSGEGVREVVNMVKRGEYVVILADQKVTDGESVKFFHKEAVTTTSIARIALKYGVDIVPAISHRKKGVDFKFEVEDPIDLKEMSKNSEDVIKVTEKINQTLERWIRRVPDQWFWVHNRWKK